MSPGRAQGGGRAGEAAAAGAARAAAPAGPPPLYTALLDDAALFPPGEAPMAEAVGAHLRYRLGPQAPLTGPFVVAAGRLAELGRALREHPGTPLAVCVTVPEGPGGLGPALEAAAALPAVEPVAVEVASASAAAGGRSGADGGGAAAAVARAAAALDRHLPRHATGYVELPRGADPRRCFDALTGTAHRAKLRTGGTRADAFPGEDELAGALCAAAERGRALKCTAGLHHAVRHTDPRTGFEHHGFLNVLLAVHAALRSGDRAEAAGVLALRDGARAAAAAAALDAHEAGTVRGLFSSFGTCSVLEPLGDLVALGLLSPAVLE
ncbi:hypothetical protein [Streptomonospora wellingtoniae]|uniref:Uncharacterized protein n=1 Tax=Streptomonospora wellingtoniae TaxID=3075544 RepID=A0ABU2L0D5_9ACTN|nr:hypothetical protein [Streptomonospora sp. DSM 45055]MDT0305016.1 hypothetical protein [Streptomonospora sp. DSM 45055]